MDCIRPASTRGFVMVDDVQRRVPRLEAVRAGVGAEKRMMGPDLGSGLTRRTSPILGKFGVGRGGWIA